MTAEQLMAKDSTMMVEKAVRGMLPKNKLGRKILKNMKVYASEEHEQTAQQPRKLEINEFK